MNFAIDYDGTFDADPTLFAAMSVLMREQGHQVWIVTMRYPSECEGTQLHQYVKHYNIPVIATGRMAKRKACVDLGVHIDVWIDDNPKAIDNDGAVLWPHVAPEGHPYTPTSGKPYAPPSP